MVSESEEGDDLILEGGLIPALMDDDTDLDKQFGDVMKSEFQFEFDFQTVFEEGKSFVVSLHL